MDGRRRRGIALACLGILALALTACGRAGRPRTTGAAADVAYAGSLQFLNEKVIGPAFARATGFAYQGRGGGSVALSHEILAGEITPNVFESVGSGPIQPLLPRMTSWYVQFASSPLVVAYSPRSRFASQLSAIARGQKPLADLFTLMEQPGFLLGRTNPQTDPQGQAFYEMVELAQSELHLPATTVSRVLGPLDNPSQVFAETTLESRLQAGQLDAASAFRSQAVQLHLAYVPLPASIDLGDPADAAGYAAATVVVPGTGSSPARTVHGTPLVIDVATVREPGQSPADAAAADAFAAYQLSAAGRRAYAAAGFTLLPETVHGDGAAVPPAVLAAVRSSR